MTEERKSGDMEKAVNGLFIFIIPGIGLFYVFKFVVKGLVNFFIHMTMLYQNNRLEKKIKFK